jgi:hypothetical protein
MTAFSQIRRWNPSKTGNIKDRQPNAARPNLDHFGEAQTARESARWEAEGFKVITEGQWSYTWQGDFPVIDLQRGFFDGDDSRLQFGIIAEVGDLVEFFSHNTHPANVRVRLDDIIYDVVQYNAEAEELPIDWQPAGDEIDFDDFMNGQWVRS